MGTRCLVDIRCNIAIRRDIRIVGMVRKLTTKTLKGANSGSVAISVRNFYKYLHCIPESGSSCHGTSFFNYITEINEGQPGST